MTQLQSNVEHLGVWYGPAYPGAGDPPSDAQINPAAYEPVEVYDQHLGFRDDDFAARGEATGVVGNQELEESPPGEPHPRAARQEQSAEPATQAEAHDEPHSRSTRRTAK